MRIAILVGRFPALSETFVLEHITGLIDRGHEVDIYPGEPGDMQQLHPQVTSYRLLDRTYYPVHLSESRLVRKVQLCGLMLLHGVRWGGMMRACFRTQLAQTRVPRAQLFRAALRMVNQRPYDIIHCHFGPQGLRGAALRQIGALHGRLVTTFHGHDVSRYIDESGPHVYDLLFRTGDLFQPISQHWKRRLIELGADEQRMVVLHMGINCKDWFFRPRRPDEDGTVRCVSVARLVEKKGIEYAIRAMAILRDRHPKLRYDIIGDGPLMASLQALIERQGLGDRVAMLGAMDQGQVVKAFDRAHILIAPSVTAADGDQEGLPAAILQGLAMGMPVISTLHTGIPEAVQHGQTGYLAPERDVEALADGIDRLMQQPQRWEAMGRRARQTAEDEFDTQRQHDRLVEIYQQLLSQRT